MLLCLVDLDPIIIYYKCSNSVSSLCLPCKIDYHAGSDVIEHVLCTSLEASGSLSLYTLSVVLYLIAVVRPSICTSPFSKIKARYNTAAGHSSCHCRLLLI